MDPEQSLQDTFAPNSICFGCGPKNTHGLRLKSFPRGDSLVADWAPKPYHAAFSGFASGGVLAALFDCHSNWTAAFSLMKLRSLQRPPGTVTAAISVRFLKPTPINSVWHLRAWHTKIEEDKVTVEGETLADVTKTAIMSGLFVAVKENHPAFHRWE